VSFGSSSDSEVENMGPDQLVFSSKMVSFAPIILLYIGPETMLPLLSALAALGGVLLMFWQRFVGLVRKIWRLIVRKQADI
jgi:hypothetical protein